MNQTKVPDIFIVSSGRSGTTLLVKILNASQQISIPYESDFIARAYTYYSKKKRFNETDYEQIVKIFQRSSQPPMWNMTHEYLVSYLKASAPQNFMSIFSIICSAYHCSSGTESLRWGIKAPVLIASVDKILDIFPNSKIIHIVRDGRDVCLSYQSVHKNSQTKFGPRGIIANALYWVEGLRRIESLNDERIYEFRYEDLVTRPDDELKRLCHFLDINYLPEIHENYMQSGKGKKLISDHLSSTIHAKLNQKLDPKNIQKYVSYMPKVSKLQFELFAAPYLEKYGYKLTFPYFRSGIFQPIRAIAYFAARKINDIRYSLRDRRICLDE